MYVVIIRSIECTLWEKLNSNVDLMGDDYKATSYLNGNRTATYIIYCLCFATHNFRSCGIEYIAMKLIYLTESARTIWLKASMVEARQHKKQERYLICLLVSSEYRTSLDCRCHSFFRNIHEVKLKLYIIFYKSNDHIAMLP